MDSEAGRRQPGAKRHHANEETGKQDSQEDDHGRQAGRQAVEFDRRLRASSACAPEMVVGINLHTFQDTRP